MKVMTVFGTRPEAVKMAPVVRALEADPGTTPVVCVTGQHREMLDSMLDLFAIRPDYDLDLMRRCGTLHSAAAATIETTAEVFADAKPDVVLVQGDTTTAVAAALSAFYAGVPVGHVEAGLRTGDLSAPWPEEANRKIISAFAALHFAPTETAADNLRAEQVPEDKIAVTGNTVIDALLETRDRIAADAALDGEIAARFPYLGEKPFVLVTGHRRESFGARLEAICSALARIGAAGTPVVYAVHLNPNVKGPVERILGDAPNVHLVPPQDYLAFVWLMSRAKVIVSDSGGVQEEAPSLNRPVLVTRETTERPEALAAGATRLVGADPDRIFTETMTLLTDPAAYAAMSDVENPYGDGRAARRIVERLKGLAR